jgi:hypothetical protein
MSFPAIASRRNKLQLPPDKASRRLFGREIEYDCSMRIRCRISGHRGPEIRIGRVANLVIGISLFCLAPVFGQE